MKKRSTGVAILAVWFIVGGLMGIYKGYVSPDPSLKMLPSFYALASPVLGIIYLVLGVGIFMLKEWARVGVIVYQVLNVAWTVILLPPMESYMRQTVKSADPQISQELLDTTVGFLKGFSFFGSFFVLAVIAFFLTRPKVMEQFKTSAAEESPRPS